MTPEQQAQLEQFGRDIAAAYARAGEIAQQWLDEHRPQLEALGMLLPTTEREAATSVSELDLEAIRARAQSWHDTIGDAEHNPPLTTLEHYGLMAAQQDVPALLDRIAELERQHAAALAIVDALANEARYQSETGEGSTAYLARLITKAQAFMAGMEASE